MLDTVEIPATPVKLVLLWGFFLGGGVGGGREVEVQALF